VGISVVDQGLPTLTGFVKEGLEVSAFQAGLVPSSFVAGRCLGAYASGVAADRLGERNVLLAGCAVTGLLVCLAAGSPLSVLFVLLFLGGLASSVATPAGGSLVVSAFPRRRHGLALGLRQAGVPAGGLVAAALLPWAAQTWDWRVSLGLAGVVAAVAAVPLLFIRAAVPATAPEPAAARRGVHRDRNVVLLTAWGCLLVSGQYGLVAYLALDVNQRFGMSLAAASLLVAVAQAAGMLGRIGWGAASDRMLAWGRKPLLLALTGVGAAGAAALYAIPSSAPRPALAAVAAFAGLGCIGFQGLMITMLADAAGPGRVGAATGFATTFLLVSIALSPPLYGLVADATGSYRAIWGVLVAVLLLAVVPASCLKERPAASAG
jgi:MFS family permease